MDTTHSLEESYLNELYRRTEGNTNEQVSMFEVGATLGLEKESARRLAEDLIAEGLVEIRTLSGGIGITAQGAEKARPANAGTRANRCALGSGPVLEQNERQNVESILAEIRACVTSGPVPFAKIEEMVIDLKTIEIQLLSPNPKTAIIRETLRSVKTGLEASENAGLADEVANMIGG